MRKVLLALGILALICSPAMAGKNANGAMVVHTNNNYNYSSATVCTASQGDPGTCEQANTTATRDLGQVVWLLAAFLPNASPGVAVVYFGINYDDACLDPGGAYKFCGPAGTLDVPDGGWPYEGRGNSVAFGSPIVGDTLFPFYVFKIDNFCMPDPGAYFCTSINPTGGYAGFVDDSPNPVLDYCYNFGCVVWGAPGHNDCPQAPIERGACCYPDGHCVFGPPVECNGQYMGADVPCDPNPCRQPEACCFEDGSCQDLLADVCAAQGGAPQGPGTVCDGYNCPQPPQACCHDGGICTFVPPEQCDGTPWGAGSTCEPQNPCPQPPTAACCYLGDCTVQTEADCLGMGGVWDPTHPDCQGVECPPVATQNTTWGAIKADYR